MLPNERKRTLSDAELRSMSRADLEMLVRECVSRSRSTSADATASEPGPAPVKQEYVMTFDSKMKPTKTPPARRAMTEEEKRDTKMMRSRGACTRCKGQKKRVQPQPPSGASARCQSEKVATP
ncbi:hypothetical protein EJ06DRAFT_527627 [Trichodelitschia bisporula]|uniref:Uncharacterized protein n=1 Tax=Trichodelitschia bisporula TaxID=703511 RepID=A0A6G1I7U1_9PEZI|nr:hypothetical protein EJ06DRAFT_527627 [Trichodelitschia bisporula]